MTNALEILKEFTNHLESLGYKKENFKYEVKTSSNKYADVVITDGYKNIIVVELKSNISLEDEDIGFNPMARHTQKLAQDLEIELYIISNGRDNIWLKTNKIGRPIKINPVLAVDIHPNNLESNSNSIQYVNFLLDHVVAFLKNHPITGDLTKDLSICLYNKVIKDLNYSDIDNNERFVIEVIDRLNDINFIEHKDTILKYIDEFLLNNKNEWQVPRWLTNFMLDFYPKDKEKKELLDIYAKFGTFASSAYLKGWEKVNSLYFNQDYEYWIKLQQILINEEEINATFSPELMTLNGFGIFKSHFDCALVAPPFDYNINAYFGNTKMNSIEVLIRKALERCKNDGWVIAIVSDSVLLSSKFKKFRKFLNKDQTIRGIINLPSEVFKPFTSVPTSLLIIQKKETQTSIKYPVFLSNLEQIPKSLFYDSEIITNWEKYICKTNFQNSKNGMVVSELNIENFHFTNYWKEDKINNLNNLFQSIPLAECIEFLKRGNDFKNDKNEEVPYIAPATIRSMHLREENLSYTSNEKMPSNYIKVHENDILINIISTHRGSAAVVPKSLEGLGINKHIVLIRPNQNIILPYYLALALNSNYVKKQFEEKAQGTVIPSLKLKSFESLYIPLPTLSEQENICIKYKSKLQYIKKRELELNKEKEELNKILLNLGKKIDDKI